MCGSTARLIRLLVVPEPRYTPFVELHYLIGQNKAIAGCMIVLLEMLTTVLGRKKEN